MTEQLKFELSTGVYEFTRTGIKVTGESTQSEWEILGEGLKAVDEARQWGIGDWLNDGDRHYGDGLYKRGAEITGYAVNVLQQFASFSKAIPHESLLRNKDLTYSHHKEVASVKSIVTDDDGTLALDTAPDTDKMSEFLSLAAGHGWTVAELRAEVKRYKEEQREHMRLANEPEKYSVIYADPPWQYTSGDQHTHEEQETVLGDHYPSMSIDELCRLPVSRMAATDAVLWLWVTSPTLEEAFEIVNAWGFKYKASMVWDKVAHNVGNYVSVRHELLLICTKGQPPKVPRLTDSVVESNRTEHSSKPELFRELIDELYPTGNRIEMFCRGEAPEGWHAWGNEVAA